MGYEIDFLSVGEGEKSGDAIALRFGNLNGDRSEQTVVVIDGGYKKSGEKLVEHINKYYNTSDVDIVVSTHPDADHTSGLQIVLEELTVKYLWMHQPWDHTDDIADLFKDGRVTDDSVRRKLRESLEVARKLEEMARSKGIPIVEPFNNLTDDTGYLRVLGPTEPFYEDLLPYFRGTPEPKLEASFMEKAFQEAKDFIQKIAETWDYETLDDSGETPAENNSSVILLLAVDSQNLLFTADAGIPALTPIVDLLEDEAFDFSTLKFIQVPHHGSQRNIGPTILNRLIGPKQPKGFTNHQVAYVSASEDGEPKHPAKKVTNAFKRRGTPVYATQGKTINYHTSDAPKREGWTTIDPLPFYDEVEE